MIPIFPYSPGFNYRRNNYHFPYTAKNIAMHIAPNSYTPNNLSHNMVRNNNINYSNTSNNNFYSNSIGVNNSFSNSSKQNCEKDTKIDEKSENKTYEQFFEIFGIKIFFDDLLILALLFFLYKEEVNDTYLYIVLFMLLFN